MDKKSVAQKKDPSKKEPMPHRQFDDSFKDLTPAQQKVELGLFRRLLEGIAAADPERFKAAVEKAAGNE